MKNWKLLVEKKAAVELEAHSSVDWKMFYSWSCHGSRSVKICYDLKIIKQL